MNKALFWTGITFQSINMLVLLVIGLSLIEWTSETLKIIAYSIYGVFNLASLYMIFIGALSK